MPVSTQIVAPFSSLTWATFRLFFTMKAWPVKKLTARLARPRSVLRVSVCVESRISTSISPDCSTEKRTLAGGADVLDLLGIAEHRRGDGPAIGDVEPLPLAGGVLEREAGNAGVDAADQLVALLHRVQRRALDVVLRRGGLTGASSQASAQQPAVAKERNRNITPSVYRGFNPFRP